MSSRTGTCFTVAPPQLLHSSSNQSAMREFLGDANISTMQGYAQLDFLHPAKVYDATRPQARRR